MDPVVSEMAHKIEQFLRETGKSKTVTVARVGDEVILSVNIYMPNRVVYVSITVSQTR